MDTITDGVVAIIHYTLKNDAGEVLDSSEGGDPFTCTERRTSFRDWRRSSVGSRSGTRRMSMWPLEEGYGLPNPAMIRRCRVRHSQRMLRLSRASSS